MEPVALAALAPLDRAAATPLTHQLYLALRAAVRDGRLPAGFSLPSSRTAAMSLGVSRNTVNAAYDLLRAEGVVTVRAGATPRVSALDEPPARPPRPAVPEGPLPSARGRRLATDERTRLYARMQGHFPPGDPDEALFPRELWARTLRRVAQARYGDAISYGSYEGLPRLREVLAERLLVDRGVRTEPDRILVTAGAQSAMGLIARVLADPGDAALIEEPGYTGTRSALRGAGLRLVPLPVDGDGADIERVDGTLPVRLAYVTPSNQYPLGVRMTLARRLALLAHARAHGAVVVEDDYDGEFHWRGGPIAALHALGEGNEVIYMGSASKSLLPGVRLGWLVVPPQLADTFRIAHRTLGVAASVHVQAALAELMANGAYRAHLRRIARIYAGRGALLANALGGRFGGRLQVNQPDGGLQLTVELADYQIERTALQRLGAAGFAVAALSGYGLDRPCRPGLVIGFADATPPLVERFAAALGTVL